MNKKQVITEKDLEEYYNKVRKIKFKSYNTVRNIQDVLKKMITYNYDNYNGTIYLKGGHHCYHHKYRSIDDIIKISKFYYPELTIKDIFNELKIFENNLPNRYKINFTYCPDIKKTNITGTSSYATGLDYFINSDRNFKTQGFKNCKIQYNYYL